MVQILLIMIVRNESKIIQRCLENTLGVIDGFFILDTGSTDTTKEIILQFLSDHPELKGKVESEKFINFGETRTQSYLRAKKFLQDELNWDENETYGLLLDADHILKTDKTKFSKELLGSFDEYRIKQKDVLVQYFNTRLIRMSENWVCLGRTHEVWTIKSLNKTGTHAVNIIQDENLIWIDDVSDGGCKNDKFERDERLLLQGVEEDPKIMYAIHLHSRYYFYLGQTYHYLQKYAKSIEFYNKRLEQDDTFDEEKWLTKVMILKNYIAMQKLEGVETYYEVIKTIALDAYYSRPKRVESLQLAGDECIRLNKIDDAKMFVDLAKKITSMPEHEILTVNEDIYRVGTNLLEYTLEKMINKKEASFFVSSAIEILNKLNSKQIALQHYFIQELVTYTGIMPVEYKPIFVPECFSSLSITCTDTGFDLFFNKTLFELSPDFQQLGCQTFDHIIFQDIDNKVILYDKNKFFIPNIGSIGSDCCFDDGDRIQTLMSNPSTCALLSESSLLTSFVPWKINNVEKTFQTKFIPNFLKFFFPVQVAVDSPQGNEKIILGVAHFGNERAEKTLLCFVYVDEKGNYTHNSIPFSFYKDKPIGVHSFTVNYHKNSAVLIYFVKLNNNNFVPRLVEFSIPADLEL
jgi:tetratricopeptide (TPR) repeat protein